MPPWWPGDDLVQVLVDVEMPCRRVRQRHRGQPGKGRLGGDFRVAAIGNIGTALARRGAGHAQDIPKRQPMGSKGRDFFFLEAELLRSGDSPGVSKKKSILRLQEQGATRSSFSHPLSQFPLCRWRPGPKSLLYDGSKLGPPRRCNFPAPLGTGCRTKLNTLLPKIFTLKGTQKPELLNFNGMGHGNWCENDEISPGRQRGQREVTQSNICVTEAQMKAKSRDPEPSHLSSHRRIQTNNRNRSKPPPLYFFLSSTTRVPRRLPVWTCGDPSHIGINT